MMEKRKRANPKPPKSNSRKRQRLSGETPKTPPQSTKRTPKEGKIVRLDKLQWKDVGIPDRMDDYEGFFGLEEIEGIDVVRDESGTVSFRDAHPERRTDSGKASSEQPVDDDAQEEENLSDEDEVHLEEDEEEWAGFSEDENAEKPMEAGLEETEVVSKSKEKKGKKKAGDKTNGTNETVKPKSQKTILKKESAVITNGAQKEGKRASVFDALDDEALDGEEVDVSGWFPLNLSEDTVLSLSKMKFPRPTPIQAKAIPEIMAGHDVIGKASTGSGKTLTFGIPILEHFLSNPQTYQDRKKESKGAPLALIVSPTRELAHQISEHLKNLVSNANLDRPAIVTLTGGLSIHKQQRLLADADIVIGTPGRVWEIISQGHGTVDWFKQIRFLVIDEADRLLSEGHFQEFEEILNVLESKEIDEAGNTVNDVISERQTLIFSATFHKSLQQKLVGKSKAGGDVMDKKESMEYLLKRLNFREERPKFIDVNPISQMADGLREGLVECGGTEKDLYLYALLMYHPKKRTLVFTNSISAVRRLTPYLQNLNLKALALHSNMPQKARLRSIERFTEQPGSILVATDVAARGLDIPGVQLIVHYHLPRAADMYVHRSGRTARVEASGSSILICGPEEVQGVRRLVAKVHAKASESKKNGYFMRSIDIDRRIVQRLKTRASLAKKLADTTIAKEKKNTENDWMRGAAEELGVDYDSEDFEKNAPGRQGRGNKRKKAEREARDLTKAETQAMRAELKALLAQRVNVGVSERYLTSGGVDIDALLKAEGNGEFLGHASGLGFDDDV